MKFVRDKFRDKHGVVHLEKGSVTNTVSMCDRVFTQHVVEWVNDETRADCLECLSKEK